MLTRQPGNKQARVWSHKMLYCLYKLVKKNLCRCNPACNPRFALTSGTCFRLQSDALMHMHFAVCIVGNDNETTTHCLPLSLCPVILVSNADTRSKLNSTAKMAIGNWQFSSSILIRRGRQALDVARKVLQMQELEGLELYSFQAVAKGTGLDVRLDKVAPCYWLNTLPWKLLELCCINLRWWCL